ncbi:hypothetical protein BD310DRAFT_940952 [Dichomitus squalens]|uniref:Uncharacterized protein n=1 Tax=Dichomitus squalens TaxID=114155 RepID=A0A4Q9PG19_9APHY|nr:hypothetical protein BD310DRAFT_940952 [Dichomitus squalens]
MYCLRRLGSPYSGVNKRHWRSRVRIKIEGSADSLIRRRERYQRVALNSESLEERSTGRRLRLWLLGAAVLSCLSNGSECCRIENQKTSMARSRSSVTRMCGGVFIRRWLTLLGTDFACSERDEGKYEKEVTETDQTFRAIVACIFHRTLLREKSTPPYATGVARVRWLPWFSAVAPLSTHDA